MKIVLDTNVLIAALIARGTCAELVEHCALNHSLITSQFIFEELRRHLASKFKYSDQDADEAIALLGSQMEVVTPRPLEQRVCRDADDDNIIATAVAGDANCIVTGDKDLLTIHKYGAIRIVSPGEFSDFEANWDDA